MAKIVVNFSIEEETLDRLRVLRKETDVPMSRVVERGILNELKRMEKAVEPE